MSSLYEEELAAISEGGGFQVYPKTSTPHLDSISDAPLDGAKALSAVCARCSEDEVWICLQCHMLGLGPLGLTTRVGYHHP